MNGLVSLARSELRQVILSTQHKLLQPYPNSSTNKNTIFGVYTNTILYFLTQFSFNFKQYSTSPSNTKTITIATCNSNSNALPKELSSNVEVLTCESTAKGGACQVYLVGTIHDSQESCKQVRAIINFLKPSVVFLELCPDRTPILTPTSLQFDSKLEDSEFRVAVEEAIKYGGKVVLGDRLQEITEQRLYGRMPLWARFPIFLQSVIFCLAPSSGHNEKMDDLDVQGIGESRMIFEMFPALFETIVRERDQYMSYTLLKVASENSLVVAVVGKGHLQGMKRHWKQPIEVEDLLTIPPPKLGALKIFTTVGVAMLGVGILSSIYLSSFT